jgi:hypothetical protein
MVALLRTSYGSLNDLYAVHEELLGGLNWRDADAALRRRADHLGDAEADLMSRMARKPSWTSRTTTSSASTATER